jgi:hypothetical protein
VSTERRAARASAKPASPRGAPRPATRSDCCIRSRATRGRAYEARAASVPPPASAASLTHAAALPPPSRSVYIGNYSYQADEKDLAALAEKYGKFKAMEMKTGAPYSR